MIEEERHLVYDPNDIDSIDQAIELLTLRRQELINR